MMQLPCIPDVDSIHCRQTTTTTPSSSPIASSHAERLTRRTSKTVAFRSTDLSMSSLKPVPPSKGSKVMYSTPMMSPATETSTTTTVGTATSTESSSNQSYVINRLVDVANGSALEATTISSGSGLESFSTSNTPWNITYTSFPASSYSNCSAHFTNYTQPQPGIFCNWVWDSLLCWPPTPAGVLARMNCPSGYHGVDTRKFAHRKCEIDGHWGVRPNDSERNPAGWTDYGPCYKPEVIRLMQEIKDVNLYMDIAQRIRTLEIIGLCISLLALIISLAIFCAFRSLRNNRTKIHKNLFIAMVLQVIVRLTLYLDQFRRGKPEAATNTSLSAIENTPYLCEASYVLLEYARTAMFMWMFIEGLYLHNMVTVAVFQGSFPIVFFSLLGWGVPVVMTTVWVHCTALFMDTSPGDCMWNYNLTPYYWILEGPRLTVILLNFFFLVNIIRVLVVKLRQSQASDIEQTRKAVRAAIVLLPLLGITNLLHLVPALKTAWKFALWSYSTYFLTSFQGFFIALIYCFLNGEVRAVLLKSLSVWMSVRGHSEWVPKRASMYSGAYNTAPDTDALQQPGEGLPTGKRVSPPNKRVNCRKGSSVSIVIANEPQRQRRNNNYTSVNGCQNVATAAVPETQVGQHKEDTPSASALATRVQMKETPPTRSNWMITLCFRGQKNKCVMPPATQMSQQIFMTPQLPTLATTTTKTAAATKQTTATTTTTTTLSSTTTTVAVAAVAPTTTAIAAVAAAAAAAILQKQRKHTPKA